MSYQEYCWHFREMRPYSLSQIDMIAIQDRGLVSNNRYIQEIVWPRQLFSTTFYISGAVKNCRDVACLLIKINRNFVHHANDHMLISK